MVSGWSEGHIGAQYAGRWEGGEVLRLEHGTRSYVVSRTIRGLRFRFSTRARTVQEARAVCRRFIADPDRFQLVAPPADPSHGPVFLDEQLIASFLAHSEGKGNTSAWRRRQGAHLRLLQRGLEGEDLRTLELGRACRS